MEHDRPGRILFGGIFYGAAFFEIVESYLAYRIYTILGKILPRDS